MNSDSKGKPFHLACSTVTVTKCQAALRTLQAFPFFRPTCLCKEPGIDPDCNYFRDFLFDHPCGFVSKKEKDPYPVDALPTCNHALSVCQQERKCIKLFEDFKLHCKVRENKCRMEDRNLQSSGLWWINNIFVLCTITFKLCSIEGRHTNSDRFGLDENPASMVS
ncbi:AAEL000145-PA [Aedes aegypti]|uniref:AAEL000145-PA n=1 Tax=Aedes aegypti TaxID=7159 RepID=Q17Q49_AEDAE|nr:AAEL000145-PA [Aedes aegypti]